MRLIYICWALSKIMLYAYVSVHIEVINTVLFETFLIQF